jgi:DHA3 family macrolide efflux protein-like MFS transporter
MISWPGLLMIGLMAVLINFLLTPAVSLLPLLVRDYFKGDALELGWVNSAAGIGVVIGGLLLGVWGGFKRKIMTTFFGLLGLGIGVLVMALAPPTSILWPVGASLIFGIMQPITNGPIGAIMQSTVAPDMQARVSSLLGSLASGMAPIGLLIAGPISDLIGIQTWFLFGGILCLLMGVAGFFIPAMMNIEDGRSQAGSTEELPTPSLGD